jgi:hypothetical protein
MYRLIGHYLVLGPQPEDAKYGMADRTSSRQMRISSQCRLVYASAMVMIRLAGPGDVDALGAIAALSLFHPGYASRSCSTWMALAS